MLFYILVLACVIFIARQTIRTRSLEVFALAAVFCVACLTMFIVASNTVIVGASPHIEERYALRLQAPKNQPNDAAYFLGTGTKNGVETVSYTYGAADHPDVHAFFPEKQSSITQDASIVSSQAIVSTYSGYNMFIQPFHFVFPGSVRYDFHVPVGSVSGYLNVDSK